MRYRIVVFLVLTLCCGGCFSLFSLVTVTRQGMLDKDSADIGKILSVYTTDGKTHDFISPSYPATYIADSGYVLGATNRCESIVLPFDSVSFVEETYPVRNHQHRSISVTAKGLRNKDSAAIGAITEVHTKGNRKIYFPREIGGATYVADSNILRGIADYGLDVIIPLDHIDSVLFRRQSVLQGIGEVFFGMVTFALLPVIVFGAGVYAVITGKWPFGDR